MSLTEINAIDENYPIAGLDQSSQTFRDNFANIKTALTDLDTQLTATIITVLDDISDVDTTSVAPVTDDVLSFDGSDWVPVAIETDLVFDLAPQLGAMLDNNAFGIGDGTNLILDFVEAGTPVNWFAVSNANTGDSPSITVTGSDANVSLTLKTRNDGAVIIDTDTGTDAFISSGSGLPLFIQPNANVLTLRGGTNNSGNGYDTLIHGGDSTGGDGDGGFVIIRPGLKDGTGDNGTVNLRDEDNNNIVVFQKTLISGTAVNYSIFFNGLTGNSPGVFVASSVDTDIGFDIETIGTGKVSLSGILYPNTDGSSGDVLTTDGAGVLSFAAPTDLGEFAVASLPNAALNADAYALATNASGGRTVVRSDGTDWKVIAVEGATVTV